MRSWDERLHEKLGDEAYAHRIESVKRFERQLTDNGYLVVKLFLQVSKKEQEKRIEHLSKEKDTRWRVSRNDRWQNEHYEKCLNAFDSYLKETNLRQHRGISLMQNQKMDGVTGT